MISSIMLYTGAAVIFLWGVGHLAPTKNVVGGFGSISEDNKRVITMEWLAEGLTLCFLGLLVFFVSILGGFQNFVSIIVYRASALMLAVLAVLSLFTGARTSVVPMKICPYVKIFVAVLFWMGSTV